MAETSLLSIDVPEQGISKLFSIDEAVSFFEAEREFFGRDVFNQNVVVFNATYGGGLHACSGALQKVIAGLKAGDTAAMDAHLVRAKNYSALISQGVIGQFVSSLLASSRAEEAKFVTYLYSNDYLGNPDTKRALAPFRVVLFANPGSLAFSDLAAARTTIISAKEAEATSATVRDEIQAYADEKTHVFEKLEQVYREKIVLEEPAKHWETVAKQNVKAWRVWLAVFAILAIAPASLAFYHSEWITDFVAKVTSTNTGGVSLGGVAAITVPALFYGWILKNLSRLFIQSKALADDAEHRRVLALAYLGLAENPKLNISEAERALILNALFRPLPNQVVDEGPPSGILELVRPKP